MIEVFESNGLTGTAYRPLDGKHGMTGYYLTEEEMRRKDAEVSSAKYNANEAKRKAKDDIDRANRNAASQVKSAQDEAEKSINNIKTRANQIINDLKAQLAHEKSLNENLKRVATERANKARNLDKHDRGYLVMNWQPFHYKRTIKNGRTTTVYEYDFYKITIQTPWDCSLPESNIDRIVIEALEDDTLMITNASDINWFKNNVTLDVAIDNVGDNEHMIMHRQYKSNVKDGFWEVTFTTNFEPTIIAKHRKKYA